MKISCVLGVILLFVVSVPNLRAEQETIQKWTNEQNWPESVRSSSAIEVEPGDEELIRSLKEYHNASLREFRYVYRSWLRGGVDFRSLIASTDQLFEVRGEISSAHADDLEILKNKLEIAKLIESQAQEILEKIRDRDFAPRFTSQNPYLQHPAAVAYRHKVSVELLKASGGEIGDKAEP